MNKTSVYKFYQFWLNTTDADAEKYIKIFTFLDKATVEQLIEEHKEAPHQRILQKKLAEEVTTFVHSEKELSKAIAASSILFGKSTDKELKGLDEQTFLDIFDGVPQAIIEKAEIEAGLDMISALAAKTKFLKSNGDARRALKENSIAVNKVKVKEDYKITTDDLVANKYIILQRGKKNYFLLQVN